MLAELLAERLKIGIKSPSFTLHASCPDRLRQAVWASFVHFRAEAAPIHVRRAQGLRVRVFRLGSYVVKEYTGDVRKVATELAVLKQLQQHPSLVSFLFLVDEGARLSVVMEWAGEGLREALAGQACPEELAQHITHQLTSSLAGLHQQGIIHRDVKPDNIALQPDFTPKLFDWGEALLLDRLGAMTDKQLARAAGVAGTPLYMPPEMLARLAGSGQPCHHAHRASSGSKAPCSLRELTSDKLDVWGLGTVLYLLLAGRDILQDGGAGYSLADMAERLGASSGVALPAGAAASPAARDFLAACLQRDPARRASAAQLLQHPWLAGAAAAPRVAAAAAAAMMGAPAVGANKACAALCEAGGGRCGCDGGGSSGGSIASVDRTQLTAMQHKAAGLPFSPPATPLRGPAYTIATAMYGGGRLQSDSSSSIPSTPSSAATGATL